MSLRTALAALPDDRATAHAVREVVECFAAHVGEPLPVARVGRATGLELDRVLPVLHALIDGSVVDCDGDPGSETCTFEPGSVLSLEVDRFLRSSGTASAKMQSSIGRFRSRLGR